MEKKKKYESPKIIELEEQTTGEGECLTGSNDSGACEVGNSAGGQCAFSGNLASSGCLFDGNTPS